jgi:hypothetical protein
MKQKLKDLRTEIIKFLDTLTSAKIYYITAPSDAQYPYVVYQIKTYPKDNNMERLQVTIDGYGDNPDSSDFEDMMFDISGDGDDNQGLDKKVINTDDYSYVFALENELDVEEKTGNRHRQQIYYGSIIGV